MKKAQLTVVTFTVICPHCQEETIDPFYHSYNWIIHEVKTGQVFRCEECGGEFVLPKLVTNNRL